MDLGRFLKKATQKLLLQIMARGNIESSSLCKG